MEKDKPSIAQTWSYDMTQYYNSTWELKAGTWTDNCTSLLMGAYFQ